MHVRYFPIALLMVYLFLSCLNIYVFAFEFFIGAISLSVYYFLCFTSVFLAISNKAVYYKRPKARVRILYNLMLYAIAVYYLSTLSLDLTSNYALHGSILGTIVAITYTIVLLNKFHYFQWLNFIWLMPLFLLGARGSLLFVLASVPFMAKKLVSLIALMFLAINLLILFITLFFMRGGEANDIGFLSLVLLRRFDSLYNFFTFPNVLPDRNCMLCDTFLQFMPNSLVDRPLYVSTMLSYIEYPHFKDLGVTYGYSIFATFKVYMGELYVIGVGLFAVCLGAFFGVIYNWIKSFSIALPAFLLLSTFPSTFFTSGAPISGSFVTFGFYLLVFVSVFFCSHALALGLPGKRNYGQ